jgi:hypothetical protein
MSHPPMESAILSLPKQCGQYLIEPPSEYPMEIFTSGSSKTY